MFSFQMSTESVGSRRELVANCSHRRRDATRQLRRVGVGGVYWAGLWLLIRLAGRFGGEGGVRVVRDSAPL